MRKLQAKIEKMEEMIAMLLEQGSRRAFQAEDIDNG